MNLLTHTTSRFVPSSILIFALILSGCGGGGGSKSPDTPPTSTASSVSSTAVSSSSSIVAVSSISSSTPVSSSSSSNVSNLSSSSSNSIIASSSSSAVAVSTTYNVNVNVPASLISQNLGSTWQQKLGQFFVPAAYADTPSSLTADNFAVVVVDLAGNVLERITLKPSDVGKNSDGTWFVHIPGTPRIDRLIVADITKPIVLPVASNINQSSLVFAPTTEQNLDVGIASTAAFKTFIDELGGTGTFASLNIDPTDAAQVTLLKDLVGNIQESIENQVFTGFSTVEAAVASIQTVVTEVVKQEVLNIKNPTQSNLVSAIQSEGGLHWYETDDDDMTYVSLTGSEPAKDYIFNGAEFEVNLNSDNNELILLNGAWVRPADNIKVKTLNANGSILLQDTVALDDTVTIKAIQSVSLEGRNIVDMLSANIDTKDFAQSSINPSAAFGAGANAYRIQVSDEPYDKYSFWFHQGDKTTGLCDWNNGEKASDYGGNCNRVVLRKPNNQYAFGATAMTALKSPNVTPGQNNSVVVDIGGHGSFAIGVQLVNDVAKTARFYRYSPGDWRVFELVATATYTELNLPGLSTDAAAIELQLPQAVLNASYFEFETLVFVKQDGSVRLGRFEAAGQEDNSDSILMFNGIANTNIQSALNSFVSPLAGKWGDINSDVFTFTNKTFVHSKISGSDTDPNCKTGTSTGNYAWNSKTFIMKIFIHTDTTAVDPTDSCSIDTGIKWKPVSGGLEVTYQEDGEDVTFLAPKIITE